MTHVTPTVPSEGEEANASDISIPVQQIADVVNGGLDDSNINYVSGSKLVDGTVVTAKIADSNVTTAKINDSAITTAKLANASITADKLSLNPQTSSVATAQTTTSSSYTDLATSGPAVTATIGANGKALVTVTSLHYNSGANDSYHSFAVSGASTVAAGDASATSSNGTAGMTSSTTTLVTGLIAGSNTFTSKYKAGSGTATFLNRSITVIPL